MIIKPNDQPFTLEISQSEVDGAWVIFVLTDDLEENADGPKCRIYINDDCVHENPPYPTGEDDDTIKNT